MAYFFVGNIVIIIKCVIKFLESISEIYLFISEIKLEQDAISCWGDKAINDCGIKYKTFFSYYLLPVAVEVVVPLAALDTNYIIWRIVEIFTKK